MAPAAPQGASGASGGGLSAWWGRLPRGTKTMVVVGGAVGVVVLYLYMKNRSAAAAAAGTGTQAGGASLALPTTSNPGTVSSGGGYLSGAGYSPTPQPTASVNLPSGAAYSGPAAGLGQVLSQLQQGSGPTTPPKEAIPSGTITPSGPYLYGNNEVSWVSQNVGQYGITASEANDVAQAYEKMAASNPAQANAVHYTWVGPGNVTTA